MIASNVDVFGRKILLRLLKYFIGKQKMNFVRYATLAKTLIMFIVLMMVFITVIAVISVRVLMVVLVLMMATAVTVI